MGYPAILKTRRWGYDGKGQQVLRERADVAGAFEAMGSRPLILEGLVDFRRELSIVAVRSAGGERAFYPLVENEHRDGILRVTRAPAPGVTPELQAQAEEMAGTLLDHLDYVGVVAVELFDTVDGLLANEMAPRVHNSGHWTQDGGATSQFENHLRAILGLPLGSVEPRGPSGMVNLIGELPPVDHLLAIPGVHLHLYGKEPRTGRKLGHVNVVGRTEEERDALLDRVRALVG